MSPTSLLSDARSGRNVSSFRCTRTTPIEIALVNNMPDGALVATERQFTSAVQAAVGNAGARIRRFTLPLIPRSSVAAKHVAENHGTFDDLLGGRFDAVIVTGTEPRAARLDQEPYWPDLARLVEWADDNTATSLWSCLAAHAAVLHLHGIERRRLSAKLSGVFKCRVDGSSSLLAGLGTEAVVPHSRYNDVSCEDLLAHGYDVLRESDVAGVDLFTWRGRSQFIFLQGHPEYDADTLLREYRRDVGRYLRRERDTYPDEPANYFTPKTSAIFRAYRRRALAHRDPALFEVFPNVVAPAAINHWRAGTVTLYRNWLAMAVSETSPTSSDYNL